MSVFQFKQFEINQDKCAMKIGTDGVLLGAWANIAQASSILDIGTGTGVLALMAAQRNLYAKIDAVEIEPQAYEQATQNLANSKWTKRLQIFHQPIQDYAANQPTTLYDSIISNPPYFRVEASSTILNPARQQARSTASLSFDVLLDAVLQLLHPTGNFSLILPVQEGNYFIELASQKGFFVKRYIEVIPRAGKISNRLLIELVLAPTSCLKDNLTLRTSEKKQQNYSHEFIELHKDFLLFL